MKSINMPDQKDAIDPSDFKKRQTRGYLITLIVLFIIIAVIGENLYIFINSAWICLSISIIEVMSRLIDFCFYNSNLKKDTRYLNMLQSHLLDFNARSRIIVGIAVAILICFKDYEYFFTGRITICFCFAYLIIKVVNLEESEYRRGVWLERFSDGLDYGTCMAHSFFHGYLQIMLPHKGDENKGILELMEQYESVHDITIPVKKLFVLTPAKLYCPPDLSKMKFVGDAYLEACATLSPIQRDVGGVKNRVFKNSVYKICKKDLSPPVYIVVEGASPLLTMWNTFKHTSKFQRTYEAHKGDIVRKFYCTLKDMIAEHEECKDLCELVYYDDSEEEVDIASLLLRKICESTTGLN